MKKISLNFDDKIRKMETLINIWSQRKLSLKGKVTILKSFIISQVSYLLSVLFVPYSILQKIDKLIFNFLWNGKTPKVRRDTIIGNINEEGGMKMPDIFSIHKTSKISWIKRLSSEGNSKWKMLMLHMLSLNKCILSHKIPDVLINKCKSRFHKQLLECWSVLKNIKPIGDNEILNEYIFYNNIKAGNTSLAPKMFGLTDQSNVYDTKIIDILNLDTGTILNLSTLNSKLNWNLNFLQHMRLKSIVSSMIQQISQSPIISASHLACGNHIKIKNKMQLLNKTKTKDIYQELVKRFSKAPVSLNTWINLHPFLETHDWQNTYVLPYQTMREPYFQSFQFKVLHRIINCNDNLFRWKILGNPTCFYCTSADTIEHHFFTVLKVGNFGRLCHVLLLQYSILRSVSLYVKFCLAYIYKLIQK